MASAPRYRVRAYAKINLGLNIAQRRPDGFHELRTILQTISLADDLVIEVRRGRGISLTVTGDAPADSSNLAWRAAALAAESWAIRGHVALHLTKRIPAGAGLGGGSSDAAAVLRALALTARRPPAPAAVLALGAQLGSDVPALLLGGTVLGLGRGEEVYTLADLAPWHCVLAMPRGGAGKAISTPEAYARWDLHHPGLTPLAASATIMRFCSLVQQVLPAFRAPLTVTRNREFPSGGSKVHAGIENDFQPEVFSLSPDFPRIHRQLQRASAAWVSLTGSGAAQFGLFAEAGRAAQAAARLAVRDRSWHARFVPRSQFLRGVSVVS